MIIVRNLRLDTERDEKKLKTKAARELRVPPFAIKSLKIIKRSLDARKKNDIHWLYSVAVTLDNEKKVLANNKSKNVAEYEEFEYEVPRLRSDKRPVVAGFGPGGMFAALVLSMAGLRPIVLERGSDAETRKRKVEAMRSLGVLDTECNVQFGEGGAGTFSDGKLNTGIRDKRISYMLRTFYEHGAPESILYDAKPHIGTDILINVVQSIRREIISLGGEVIAAASEEGGVCTNGMSNSKRDGENANSALLVTLHTEDFPYPGALGGMYWQRDIERAAFAHSGDYRAPAQLAGDFLAHKKSEGAGRVTPSYRPGVSWCDLHEVLPESITRVLENALPELGKKLRGFDAPDAVLTAPETRSSSPVRILRDERRRSLVRGVYPCGEGAGYAGGISSAAVDGMKCAESLIENL